MNNKFKHFNLVNINNLPIHFHENPNRRVFAPRKKLEAKHDYDDYIKQAIHVKNKRTNNAKS